MKIKIIGATGDAGRPLYTPAGHPSGPGWLAARRRLRYQRTISTPAATAKAIPNATRSPFQAAFSNARPPKYPRSDAYKAQMSAGQRNGALGGVTARPTGDWTVPQARHLAPGLGERFGDFRFLIRDRGPNFTASVDAVFQATGTTIVRTAVQAPRMKAICERLISTLRREFLDRILILNQAHLRAVLAEYQEHYSTARPHQGTGQHIPHSGPAPRVTAADPGACQIRRKLVLSGLINEYERAA